MDRGAWQATVHWVTKILTRQQLTHTQARSMVTSKIDGRLSSSQKQGSQLTLSPGQAPSSPSNALGHRRLSQSLTVCLPSFSLSYYFSLIHFCCQSLSRVSLFATPCTVAHQASLSVGFSRQECWSGLPFLPPGDLPDPGIEPVSPALQANSLPSEPAEKPLIHL